MTRQEAGVVEQSQGQRPFLVCCVEEPSAHTPGLGFIEIQDELSRLLGRSVDLNTPQDLSRYFRQQVLEQAEVIYAAES